MPIYDMNAQSAATRQSLQENYRSKHYQMRTVHQGKMRKLIPRAVSI